MTKYRSMAIKVQEVFALLSVQQALVSFLPLVCVSREEGRARPGGAGPVGVDRGLHPGAWRRWDEQSLRKVWTPRSAIWN